MSVTKQIHTSPLSLQGSSFLTADLSTSGNVLAYMMRKSIQHRSVTKYLADSRNDWHTAKRSIVFDDLSSLAPEILEKVSNLAKSKSVAVVDLNAFDRLPNFIDFVLGPDAVKSKLDTLIHQVREMQSANPQLSASQAVDETLRNPLDKVVSDINQSLPSGPLSQQNPVKVFRPEYISPEDAFRDRIEPKQVREFLEIDSMEVPVQSKRELWQLNSWLIPWSFTV